MFQTYKQAYNPTPSANASRVQSFFAPLTTGAFCRAEGFGSLQTINPFLSGSIIKNIKDSLEEKNVKMILDRVEALSAKICDKNAEDDEDPYNYMKTGLYILSISSFAYYFYSKRNMI